MRPPVRIPNLPALRGRRLLAACALVVLGAAWAASAGLPGTLLPASGHVTRMLERAAAPFAGAGGGAGSLAAHSAAQDAQTLNGLTSFGLPAAKGTAGSAPATLGDTNIPEGPKVERDASITVQVKKGGFDSALNSVFALVSSEGGYIAGSDLHTDSDHFQTGSISFRVPSDRFDDTVQQLRNLGTAKLLDVGGNDVTQQYVDLQARLRNDQAQDAALAALLDRATSIGDILQIRQQMGQIESEMEQLKGQIDYIDHQTTYASFQLTLSESGPVAQPAGQDTWGLLSAFATAAHRFVDSLNGLIVALGVGGPYLVILGGLALVFWRRRPPVVSPALPG